MHLLGAGQMRSGGRHALYESEDVQGAQPSKAARTFNESPPLQGNVPFWLIEAKPIGNWEWSSTT